MTVYAIDQEALSAWGARLSRIVSGMELVKAENGERQDNGRGVNLPDRRFVTATSVKSWKPILSKSNPED